MSKQAAAPDSSKSPPESKANKEDDEEEDDRFELLALSEKKRTKQQEFEIGNDSDKSDEAQDTTKNVGEPPFRNCSNLFASQATWNCASSLCCVPCAYKVGCFDVALDKQFTTTVPNQRPEQCPRLRISGADSNKNISAGPIGALGYQRGMTVLCVGDGDMSFSLALARMLCQDKKDDKSGSTEEQTQIVATSYERKETLANVYPSFDQTLQELEDYRGVKVVYNVDATNLSGDTRLKQTHFDRIVWNFPCSAIEQGQDGQNKEMESNKKLVSTFMQEAVKLLKTDSGDVHMNHKSKPPFDQWNIEQVALTETCVSSTLESFGRVVWDRSLFPPHIPRKALHSKSFSSHDACTFVFSAKGKKSPLTELIDAAVAREEASRVEQMIPPTALVKVSKEKLGMLRSKLLKHTEQKRVLSSLGRGTGHGKNNKRKKQRRR